MDCNQKNDIRPKEKRIDTFHPDTHPIQTDGMALRYRYDTNRINQILQNLIKLEIKIIQTLQNNTDQTFKTTIYIH